MDDLDDRLLECTLQTNGHSVYALTVLVWQKFYNGLKKYVKLSRWQIVNAAYLERQWMYLCGSIGESARFDNRIKD